MLSHASKSLKHDTKDIFNVKMEIDVVPNFIDIQKYERLRNTCSREQLVKPDERLVTHVSNFRPVKRARCPICVFESE